MIYYRLILFAFLFILTDVQGLNESCSKNSDCDTKNALCISGICNCDDLSYYNDTLCLPYATEYNALCYEPVQCKEYMGDNSDCRNNRCVCESKFRWYKGKCRAYVDKGERCDTDDDCYNGYDLLSLNCFFGVCSCSSDYYDRGHDCRRRSQILGDCAINSDCKPIFNINSVCTLGKCALPNRTSTNSDLYIQELDNEEISEIKQILSADAQKDVVNSVCDETERTCGTNSDCKPIFNINSVRTIGKYVLPNKTLINSEFYNQELGNEETNQIKQILFDDVQDNLSCEKDDDCRDMANSICDESKRTCRCIEETHYFYNGNCVIGLNKCDSPEDCSGNSMCFRNTCICKQGFFLKDNTCIAELGVQDTNANYANDNDCPIKPGKLTDSTCYCKNYWFNDDSNRNCIKTMIEQIQSCLTNEWCDVLGPYSFCNSTTSMCECSSFAKLNRTTFYCDKVEDQTTDICLRDNECNLNERCIDEKCECIENFARNEDDVCLPNIGASCEIVPCSHIGNSSCLSRACKCNNNFIGEENRCLKLAENLQDSCEEQTQCTNIDHTVCAATGNGTSLACLCAEEYTAINSTCYQTKRYGDPCMTRADCTRVLNRSYECRNSLCQCPVGFELKNGYCTSSACAIFGSIALLFIIVATLGVN